MKKDEENILASNRKANRNYQILETFEAGLVLKGTEVKSIKLGEVSIQEGYVQIDDNMEAWLVGSTIQPYSNGNILNHSVNRERKLLMHRKEIQRLSSKTNEKGLTIVPLNLYLLGGKIKLRIALAQGKNIIDKRETIKKRDADRDAQRAMRNHNR